MPLLHSVLRLSHFLVCDVLISLEFYIVFLSVMRKNSVLGGFKRLGQTCYRPHFRCINQTLKYEVSDSSETMLNTRVNEGCHNPEFHAPKSSIVFHIPLDTFVPHCLTVVTNILLIITCLL
jgi:hypothetical protein